MTTTRLLLPHGTDAARLPVPCDRDADERPVARAITVIGGRQVEYWRGESWEDDELFWALAAVLSEDGLARMLREMNGKEPSRVDEQI